MPSGSICCAGSGENTCAAAAGPDACVTSSMFDPACPRPQLRVHWLIWSTVMYSRPVVSGLPYVASHGLSTPAAFAELHVETNVLPPSVETLSDTLVSPWRSAK